MSRSNRILSVLACLLVSGAFGCAKSQPAIVVDYGIEPKEFEGRDIELDGKIVGKLKREGQKPRTSFPVEAGDHAIRVAGQKYDSSPEVVTVKAGEELVVFVDIKPAPQPGARPSVVLHR